MKRLALLWTLALLAACGGPAKAPELLQRQVEAVRVTPIIAEPVYEDPLDAGGGWIDAGCCTVGFALASFDGELNARLVFLDQSYPMNQNDAGVWMATACRDPKPDRFYFQVGFLADDDGGMLYVDRVNEALPVDTTGALAPEVNVFDGADGGVCEGIDAARYVSLPDGG